MNKGFVLTIDALTAAGIAIMMGIVMIGFVSAKSPSMELPYSLAEDLLSSMDAKGEFQKYSGYAGQQVQQSLQTALQVLPKSFCGNLSVRIYDANNFGQNNFYTESSCAAGKESSKARRAFADYGDRKFGIAELEIWYR